MKLGQKIKITTVILACVVLDIVLHVVTSSYSTIPESPKFSFIASILGIEITASLWALFAFSGVAFVYWQIRDEIPGENVKKGLRYGVIIALLWTLAMLEGVPLFGNPLMNECIVGLSDAIPIFVMSVFLSIVQPSKINRSPSTMCTLRQKLRAVLVFQGIFVTGRYIAYFSGVIQSGIQSKPLLTLIWTILMGFLIGVSFVILNNNKQSLKHRAVTFGIVVFGLNWAVFLLFMPLLFSGYITDAFLRMVIDTTLVTVASYASLISKDK